MSLLGEDYYITEGKFGKSRFFLCAFLGDSIFEAEPAFNTALSFILELNDRLDPNLEDFLLSIILLISLACSYLCAYRDFFIYTI